MKHRSFGKHSFFCGSSRASRRCPLRPVALSLFFLAAMLGYSPSAHTQTYTMQTLHSFSSSTEGGSSCGGLVAANGLLYGTTSLGGDNSKGTLFSINPNGTGFHVLYTFGATASDGSTPEAGLVALNGLLYGTTEAGGTYSHGTVFSFDPASGTETSLYSFGQNGSADGSSPMSPLLAVNGLLYGTTQYGGASDWGTVFAFNLSSETEQLIHSFTNANDDGALPVAGLTEVNGFLYGTTSEGGVNNAGMIYAISPQGSGYQVLHDFTSTISLDGDTPFAGLTVVSNILYGTTYQGGQHGAGTVYAIHVDGTGYQILHSFSYAGGEGTDPYSGLIAANGLLYGTTYHGGDNGGGMLYSIDPATGVEDICCSFTGPNSSKADSGGEYPKGDLLTINGTLYGTTFVGSPNSYGTIFSLSSFTVPVANTDGCTIKYDTARTNAAPGVLANDSNGGEGPLTATLVTNVKHGTLTLGSNGSFTYTPNAGYVGKDVFTYQAVNPIGHSNTTTCTLTVVPTTPAAHTDGATIAHNKARTFAAPGVLSNDDNGGQGPLTATLVSTVSHGILNFHSDGSFVYTPNSGYVGKDVFTYQAVNSVGKSNTTTCTLTVQ